MFILGLTGSIGMGKSSAASAFRREGVPVHDADAVVHSLMATGGSAVSQIEKQFPNCVIDDTVDRGLLGGEVFKNKRSLEALENILHPMVQLEENRFVRKHVHIGVKMVILDIPLLFETGGDSRCDAVAVVSAPAFLQRQRVLSRQGMTQERLTSILMHQMSNAEKCERADFVIRTGLGHADSLRCIKGIVRSICQNQRCIWR